LGLLTVSSTCPKMSEKSGNTHLPRAPCCAQWLARSQLVKSWNMAPHPTMMPQRHANERMKRSPDVAKRQSAKVAIWQGGGRQAGRRRAGSSTGCLDHESQSMVCCAGTHAGGAACMPRNFDWRCGTLGGFSSFFSSFWWALSPPTEGDDDRAWSRPARAQVGAAQSDESAGVALRMRRSGGLACWRKLGLVRRGRPFSIGPSTTSGASTCWVREQRSEEPTGSSSGKKDTGLQGRLAATARSCPCGNGTALHHRCPHAACRSHLLSISSVEVASTAGSCMATVSE
jgi:hypothetical protein